MSRLIILSNRVKMPDNKPMAGGLAVALQNVFIGNSMVWMGWNGEIEDNDNDNSAIDSFHIQQTSLTGTDTSMTYMTSALTSKQYKRFYCGFANNVLWPLFHEQANLINQQPQDYVGYQEVNKRFAQQLKKILEPDDVIWVHDYHFLSVAYHCRQLGILNRIGFFLHIPFPALPFWQSLSQSHEIIHHLAHYDLVGLQTKQDKRHCLDVLHHHLEDQLSSSPFIEEMPLSTSDITQSFLKPCIDSKVKIKVDLILKPQHVLTVDAYPIGVNVTQIQDAVSHLSSTSLSISEQSDDNKDAAMQKIVAVDRIDYSKGLLRRFAAYRDFLAHNPAYQNHLQLLQIACPSRLDLPTYQHLYEDVKDVVNDVNQQTLSVDKDWQAIDYSETAVSHEKLMALFWHSDVGWVNSLKDGMNLVAKEYIAAQNPDDPGVLLLSRYAGAAEQMKAAVIVDPKLPKSLQAGLKTALTMPLKERQWRYQTLLEGLQIDDLQSWYEHFLEDLSDRSCRQTYSITATATQISALSRSLGEPYAINKNKK